MEEKENVEKLLSEALEEGEMEEREPESEALGKLSPRYEIRQTVSLDPIVEETKQFRALAKEIDGRYDGYMARAEGGGKESKVEDERPNEPLLRQKELNE